MLARGEYLATPEVRWVAIGADSVVLRSPLIYRARNERIWRVETGFQTDFASVPRWVPAIVRVMFRGEIATAFAAILHDWLYATALVERAEADGLFFEALIASG